MFSRSGLSLRTGGQPRHNYFIPPLSDLTFAHYKIYAKVGMGSIMVFIADGKYLLFRG